MNDRKTDETPLAPHRPLTGSKPAQPPQSGAAQEPPRWSPNGSDAPSPPSPPDQRTPRTRQQSSSDPKGGQPSAPASAPGPGPGPDNPPGSTEKTQEVPRPPMNPGPPKPPPEMRPGPENRGPDMRPGPPPPPADAPTEAMPRVNAPTVQAGPPPNSANTRPQPTPQPAPQPAAKPAKPRGRPRKARLRLARVDPWSVMKIAFALSIALAIVTVVAVSIVWAVLGAAGVWDSINESVAVVLSDNSSDFDIRDYVGMGRVVGLTMIVAAADVILITAIATLGAFLYNLAATMLGGLELTLAEDR